LKINILGLEKYLLGEKQHVSPVFCTYY